MRYFVKQNNIEFQVMELTGRVIARCDYLNTAELIANYFNSLEVSKSTTDASIRAELSSSSEVFARITSLEHRVKSIEQDDNLQYNLLEARLNSLIDNLKHCDK